MVLGLKYETSMDQLKKIIEDIKLYLKSQPDLNAQPCIVVFDGFGESSLNILVVYFIPFTNGEEYLIRKSDLNFAIMEIVSREKASFAFPVREIKIDAVVVEGLKK
jgi:MscS family membrane protein